MLCWEHVAWLRRHSPGDILKPDLEHYAMKTLALQHSGGKYVHNPGRKKGRLVKAEGHLSSLNRCSFLQTSYRLSNGSSSWLNMIFGGFVSHWNICREQKKFSSGTSANKPLQFRHLICVRSIPNDLENQISKNPSTHKVFYCLSTGRRCCSSWKTHTCTNTAHTFRKTRWLGTGRQGKIKLNKPDPNWF